MTLLCTTLNSVFIIKWLKTFNSSFNQLQILSILPNVMRTQVNSSLENISIISLLFSSVQFSSVTQSCPTLCNPMNCSTPGLPVHHQLWSSLKLMSIESVMPSSHLILCHPLLLLPPIPPSIRVFSNESTFRMKWPKYWSFSFSIIPSKKTPRTDLL